MKSACIFLCSAPERIPSTAIDCKFRAAIGRLICFDFSYFISLTCSHSLWQLQPVQWSERIVGPDRNQHHSRLKQMREAKSHKLFTFMFLLSFPAVSTASSLLNESSVIQLVARKR